MRPWYLTDVVCPRDHAELAQVGARLVCGAGHRYPLVDDVPVMLLDDVTQTMGIAGESLARVQMPTSFGLRCLYHQARRRFREARGFEVRYWTVPGLKALFSRAIGPATISVDCFFGIGLQRSDWSLMSPLRKLVLGSSELLRGASRAIPVLKYAADSVYVSAVKS